MNFVTILLTTCMVTKLAFSAKQSTVSILLYSFDDIPLLVRAIFSDLYQAGYYERTTYGTFSSMQLLSVVQGIYFLAFPRMRFTKHPNTLVLVRRSFYQTVVWFRVHKL